MAAKKNVKGRQHKQFIVRSKKPGKFSLWKTHGSYWTTQRKEARAHAKNIGQVLSKGTKVQVWDKYNKKIEYWAMGKKKNPAKKNKGKKNPELVIVNKQKIPKDALARFYKLHGKNAPLTVIQVDVPKGMANKYLIELGDATRVDYKPPKGSKKAPYEYYHKHGDESGKNPTLVTTPDGKHLLILRKKGNKMRVKEWIHD